MQLSIVIPVYNERHTLGTILGVVARTLPNVNKEIIVVGDCSKDGTREWLKANFPERGPKRIAGRSRLRRSTRFRSSTRAVARHRSSDFS
jgi:glycosyltransferase involved in cell wall biosynthesis